MDLGVYDLVLFREGYATIARQITIRPGQVVSMGDRLQPGESVRPEGRATKTHDRRDERVTYEEKRREEIARRDSDGMDDWRERPAAAWKSATGTRMTRKAGRWRGKTASAACASTSSRATPRSTSTAVRRHRRRPARLRVGLRLKPGEHRIAVVRPGHKAEEQEFTVAVGEEVELEFDLESE